MNDIKFDQEAFNRLTPREIEVARHSSIGLKAPEIGISLGISARTAQNHITHAIKKLQCRNALHLIATLIRGGVI